MDLPPNPKLKDVNRLCRNQKDTDFLTFFDTNKTNLYPSVRHRYNQLIDVTANGISHLKLFTKHLKSIIDAQQLSSNSCLDIISQYREEEPTLTSSSISFVRIADEASVTLPANISNEEEKGASDTVSDLHCKTDLD